MAAPLIVGIGGTTRVGSTSDRAMRIALDAAGRAGARTRRYDGAYLADIPLYRPESRTAGPAADEFVAAVAAADGLVVASPGYHGGISGVVKNALDHLEELRDATPPYLDGRAIGCLVTAAGWQTCGSTLASLRSIAHALRAWPTPLGVMINTSEPVFDAEGVCVDPRVEQQLVTMGRQVAEFALMHRRAER